MYTVDVDDEDEEGGEERKLYGSRRRKREEGATEKEKEKDEERAVEREKKRPRKSVESEEMAPTPSSSSSSPASSSSSPLSSSPPPASRKRPAPKEAAATHRAKKMREESTEDTPRSPLAAKPSAVMLVEMEGEWGLDMCVEEKREEREERGEKLGGMSVFLSVFPQRKLARANSQVNIESNSPVIPHVVVKPNISKVKILLVPLQHTHTFTPLSSSPSLLSLTYVCILEYGNEAEIPGNGQAK